MGQMKNRKQIGINLPHAQIEWLKNKSETTGAPVSRIVEKIIDNEIKEVSNMKKFTVKYYIDDEEMYNGNKPHSEIYETEETEADNEQEAITNIIYYLAEQINSYSNNRAETNKTDVKVYNGEGKVIEQYYNFSVIK